MTLNGWIQIAIYFVIVIALVKPLGRYMARVFKGERTFLSPVLGPVETRPLSPRRRRRDARAELAHLHGRHAAVPCRRLPHALRAAAAARLCCRSIPRACRPCPNTSPSTPRQLHHQHQLAELRRREHAVSYLMQMLGLTHQNFRLGRNRHRACGGADPRLRARLGEDRRQFLGRYHPLHPLHPAADLRYRRALFLVWQGMPQTLGAYVDATTLEGAKQTIAVGPGRLADRHQELGTNGGGFFNANSAHPFENPTALSQFPPDHLDLRDSAPRSPTCSAAWSATSARAGRISRRHGDPVPRRRRRLLLGGGCRQSELRGARARSGQYGRQGGPLRHCRCRACSR